MLLVLLVLLVLLWHRGQVVLLLLLLVLLWHRGQVVLVLCLRLRVMIVLLLVLLLLLLLLLELCCAPLLLFQAMCFAKLGNVGGWWLGWTTTALAAGCCGQLLRTVQGYATS